MMKSLPRRNLLVEPLHSISRSTDAFDKTVGTHARDLKKVARRVHPQYFDCNMVTLIFTLPHVSEPAAIQRDIELVAAKWDLQ